MQFFQAQQQTDSVVYHMRRLASAFLNMQLDSVPPYVAMLRSIVASTKDPKNEAYCLNLLGSYYDRKGNFDSSRLLLQEAYRMYQQEGSRDGISMAANNLASLHFNLKMYDKALDYLKEARLNYDTANKKSYVVLTQNIGIAFNYLHMPDSGLHYLLEAMRFAEKVGLKRELGPIYSSVATYYYQTDKYDSSIFFGKKAVALIRQEKQLYMLGHSLNNLATALMYTGKYDEAEKLFREGLELVQARGERQTLLYYYRSLSEFYERTKQFELAFQYAQKRTDLADSIYEEDLKEKIAAMEQDLENERKSRELEKARQEAALKEVQLLQALTTRNALIAVVMLVVLVLGFLVYNIRLRRKANLLLLREKEWEHDRLLALESRHNQLEKAHIQAQFETLRNQIDPHFLFNSLNALSSLITEDKDKAIRFSHSFAGLFRSTLELKDQNLIKLEEELTLVQNYIFLQSIRFGAGFQVTYGLTGALDKYYVPPFSLQLLVENAIKHNQISADTPLQIDLYVEKDDLVVRNTLQLRPSRKDSTGVGLRNLQDRYRLLHEREPSFYTTDGYYFARLPLIEEE
jgi:tetratricopeptide (TPR) repeat protein